MSTPRTVWIFVGAALCCLLTLGAPAVGEEGDDAPAKPPETREVVRHLTEILGKKPDASLVKRATELEEEIRTSAAQTAAHWAVYEMKRREGIELLRTGGQMPRLLQHGGEDLAALVRNGPRFLDRMRPDVEGPVLRVGKVDASTFKGLKPGTRLLLPAGEFELPRTVERVPPGLSIRGAGTRQTILSGELDTRRDADVLALQIADCTLTGQDVFDTNGTLTLILRNVRAVGYNTGAGGSNFIDYRSGNLALYAENCVFDGSVGRGSKQHGTAFSVSARTVVMHFKGCTFVGNQHCVRGWGGPQVHFEDCVFRDNREAKVPGATYENCRFEGNGDDA